MTSRAQARPPSAAIGDAGRDGETAPAVPRRIDNASMAELQTYPTVGGFHFHVREDRWVWSDEVARMHGYESGFEPTTAQMLEQKHPDDRRAVAQVIERVITEGAPLSTHHRIVRTDGALREVLIVAFGDRDSSGPDRVEGFYIDVTDTIGRDRQQTLTRAVAEVIGRRAAIEQAKGMLMMVYRISDERAFDVLTWLSQRSNVKVHAICTALIDQVRAVEAETSLCRAEFDRLLITAGQRARSDTR